MRSLITTHRSAVVVDVSSASRSVSPANGFGRHQVAELPPIVVLFSEHRTHHLRCPGCAKKTVARLPGGVGDSPFGTDLQAVVVTVTARNRVSRRDMSELARDLFGLQLSVGAVDAICQRAGKALRGPHELLVESVLTSPVVNVDETGWFTAHEGRTMWTATTPEAARIAIAIASRSWARTSRGSWARIAGGRIR